VQAQAAKRSRYSQILRATLVLAILLGAALAALAIVNVVDRSENAAPGAERVLPQAIPQAEPVSELPEEAIDARLSRTRPTVSWYPKPGEGLTAGLYPPAAYSGPVVPADVTRFLEQNLYLPGSVVDSQLPASPLWNR
jgi:hypothetical protein